MNTCPRDCNGHGKCALGMCECDRGWTGASCAEVHFECEGGCSGHGSCVGVPAHKQQLTGSALAARSGGGREGTCACHRGYSGERCETFALPEATCLHNCSGRGICSVGGHCVCGPGYTGAACELEDTEHGSCHNNCCGHGSCRYSGGKASGLILSSAAKKALGYNGGRGTRYCACDLYWTGVDCCTPKIVEQCPEHCSGHGICVNGACVCDSGWQGEGCSVIKSACPQDCSAHGNCIAGKCSCERGFSGVACEHGDPFGGLSINAVQPYL